MNNMHRLILSALAFLANVSVVHTQTATLLSHSVIVAQPPDPIHYEKAIGNFTSTSYPSFFLGTGDSGNGYIYDTQTGQTCAVGIPAKYYERSRPFTYPGDSYAGVIASLYTSIAWLENPLNWGGSLCGGWPAYTIDGNRGAHELHLVDLDGDGKLDLLASGTSFPNVITTGIIAFQNTYNSWPSGVFAPPAGESIDVVAISGVNGGARTNIVSCNPSNGSLYWYQNPGGSAARSLNWTAHLIASKSIGTIPACTQGIALASLSVGNRDIVIVANGERGTNEPWSPGLGYYDPGSTPNSQWTFHQIDGSYIDVHQIATGILNGTSFFTIAEQEQASPSCNGEGLNDHGSSYSGCRVAVFPWNGTGFNASTVFSNLGSHNQSLYQLNGVEYMAGANHDSYQATDPSYNLWIFNFGSTSKSTLASGTYNIKNPNTGNTIDLGWALHPEWGDGLYAYLYSYLNDSSQQITYTSAGKLQPASNSADYLYNNGGALALGSSGDVFSIASSGMGYTIQDTTAGGLYVNNASAIDPPNKLPLSTTPTVWMFAPVAGGGSSLAAGTYTFQDGNAFTMDLGWAQNPQWGYGPYIYLYAYLDDSGQQITFTAAGMLQSATNSGEFLYDSGGVLAMGSTGDTFTIVSRGSGYTIFDSTAGLYVNSPGKTSPPNTLPLSSTPTVWAAMHP